MPPNSLTSSQKRKSNSNSLIEVGSIASDVVILTHEHVVTNFLLFDVPFFQIYTKFKMFGDPSVLENLNINKSNLQIVNLSQNLLRFVPLFERNKMKWSFNWNGRGIVMNISKDADNVHCEDSFASPRLKTTLMTLYWETGIRWRRNIEMSCIHPVLTTSF